jgi:subtilisin
MKKKSKVIGLAVLSLAMGISMFATGAIAKMPDSQESFRVLINGSSQEKANAMKSFGVRSDFGVEGFTTTVNSNQYAALLKNKNLQVNEVTQVSLSYQTEAAAKPGSSAGVSPSDRTPWGIEAIYNSSSIQATSGGSGITVAVLDTGVNTGHKDLLGQDTQCKDFTQRTSNLVNGVCNDKNGHGTHVAGSVLAHGGTDNSGIYGVAPDADLWAYKVLNDRGSGYSDDIANAIRHATDQAKSSGEKLIISMSLGSSSKDSLIASAVDYAYANGVLVVAAAGNDGPTANTIGYPGALPNAIAVAALENVQQNGTYRVADFSSRGNPNTDGDYVIGERDVEISAPGRAIESTWYDGSYNIISGTSMATPHVSGLAAKIWAANTSMSNLQLRTELQNRAKSNDILGGTGAGAGDDYASGFGFAKVQ